MLVYCTHTGFVSVGVLGFNPGLRPKWDATIRGSKKNVFNNNNSLVVISPHSLLLALSQMDTHSFPMTFPRVCAAVCLRERKREFVFGLKWIVGILVCSWDIQMQSAVGLFCVFVIYASYKHVSITLCLCKLYIYQPLSCCMYHYYIYFIIYIHFPFFSFSHSFFSRCSRVTLQY